MPSKATRNNRRSSRKPGKRTRKNRDTSSHKSDCKVRELKDGNVVINHKGHEFRTSYFHACPMSTKTLLDIHNNSKTSGRASECPCMRFAKQEDRFLELEAKSLCHHGDHGNCSISRRGLEKMQAIHADMVKEFGKHTMKYHRSHLTTAMRCCGGIHGHHGRSCPFLSMRGGAGPEASQLDSLQKKFRTEVSAFKGKIKDNRNNQQVIAGAYDDVLSAASSYLDAVKADAGLKSAQRSYRNMCLKNELESFNRNNRILWAKLTPPEKAPLNTKLQSVNGKLRDAIGSERAIADACAKVKKASVKGEPVAVPQQGQSQQEKQPLQTQKPVPSATGQRATYSSWSNPTMTQAAQAAAQKEVADMLKIDDKTEQSEPKPQQSKLSPEEQEFFNQKAPGGPDDKQDGQSDSAVAPSNEQSTEASGSDEQTTQEPKQEDAQPTEVPSESCKAQGIEPGSLPCPKPGEEATHQAVLQELSPEENDGCKEKAAELLSEYNSRCKAPESLSSDEQEQEQEQEQAPEGDKQEGQATDGEQEEPKADDEETKVDDGAKAEKVLPTGSEQAPMAVTTSTTTTPHEGYNEIHIVVKVPQDYPQSTTGTTGTTFESAMNTLTSTKTGGASSKHLRYKNHKVTPKRHRSHHKSLLRRKTMPKHRK